MSINLYFSPVGELSIGVDYTEVLHLSTCLLFTRSVNLLFKIVALLFTQRYANGRNTEMFPDSRATWHKLVPLHTSTQISVKRLTGAANKSNCILVCRSEFAVRAHESEQDLSVNAHTWTNEDSTNACKRWLLLFAGSGKQVCTWNLPNTAYKS